MNYSKECTWQTTLPAVLKVELPPLGVELQDALFKELFSLKGLS